jgi:hypothetical protein
LIVEIFGADIIGSFANFPGGKAPFLFRRVSMSGIFLVKDTLLILPMPAAMKKIIWYILKEITLLSVV